MDKANLGRPPYYNKWINDWQGRHDVVLSKEACAELHGALSSEPPLVSPADPLRSEAATRKDAEAAVPKPDPAIAELVERLNAIADGVEVISWDRRSIRRGVEKLIREAIATLTASNDRVAERERELDWARGDG